MINLRNNKAQIITKKIIHLVIIISLFVMSYILLIGAISDTGFKNPSAEGEDHNDWTNGANMYSSNNLDAYSESGDSNDFYNFGLVIPDGVTINGIELKIEGSSIGIDGVDADLSWNGGTTYTSDLSTPNFNGTDVVYTLANNSYTWGRTWNASEFSNSTFRVRLTHRIEDFSRIYVDHLQVKVYYTEASDTTPPYFTTIPANSSLNYLTGNLNVTFIGADAVGFGYYSVNDTRFSIHNPGGFLTNNSPMSAGNYEINVTINDTSNNINWTRYTVQVNKSSENCKVLFNETSPIAYPKTFLAWANCTTAFVLARNGTTITNNSAQVLTIGAYNFSLRRNDTTNYTFIYNESQFRIVDTTNPTITTESPTPSNNSISSNRTATIVANVSDDSNTSSFVDFDNSLIGYWSMDYCNATGCFDNSSNNNFGLFEVVSSSNISSGMRGNAINLSNTKDFLRIKANSKLAMGGNNITISMWINPNNLDGVFFSPNRTNSSDGIKLSMNTSGNIILTTFGVRDYAYSSSPLSINQWSLVTVVLDYENNVSYYIK